MKLLIFTQAVDRNSFVLGFFHRWLEEFSKHFSEVVVIAGRAGDYALPKNVKVYSFRGAGEPNKLRRLLNFWKLCRRHFPGADAAFFHMIPVFAVAALPFLIIYRPRSGLWYTHKSVTWALRVAIRAVDYVFSASKASFPLSTSRGVYPGHAIDVEYFHPAARLPSAGRTVILSAGRIARVKNHHVLIEAAEILAKAGFRDLTVVIAGDPVLEQDQEYARYLRRMIQNKGLERVVELPGPVTHGAISRFYQRGRIFVNLSDTGSLDKAVLEAMACGLHVLTSNQAFREILPPPYFLERLDSRMLAERIRLLAREPFPARALRELVVKNHNLEKNLRTISKLLMYDGAKTPS